MHEMTLGAVFALFDAAGRYLVMTNPWGSGKSTSSANDAPRAELRSSAEIAGLARPDIGANVADKSLDQMPPHVREMFGRR